jgi:hypothetical protein
VYIPIVFLTKPDNMDHLVKYYVQARPLGFWKPVHMEAVRRGLIPETKKKAEGGLFKKDWSPEEADEWTKHDLVASVFSALTFVFVAVGLSGALLLRAWGFAALILGVGCCWVMYRTIGPKLRAMSIAFEQKQGGYLERVDKSTRWEE